MSSGGHGGGGGGTDSLWMGLGVIAVAFVAGLNLLGLAFPTSSASRSVDIRNGIEYERTHDGGLVREVLLSSAATYVPVAEIGMCHGREPGAKLISKDYQKDSSGNKIFQGAYYTSDNGHSRAVKFHFYPHKHKKCK